MSQDMVTACCRLEWTGHCILGHGTSCCGLEWMLHKSFKQRGSLFLLALSSPCLIILPHLRRRARPGQRYAVTLPHSPVLLAYPFTDARIWKLLKNPRKLQANSGTQEPLSLNEMLLMIAGTQQNVGEGDLRKAPRGYPGEQGDNSAATFAAHSRPKPTGGQ